MRSPSLPTLSALPYPQSNPHPFRMLLKLKRHERRLLPGLLSSLDAIRVGEIVTCPPTATPNSHNNLHTKFSHFIPTLKLTLGCNIGRVLRHGHMAEVHGEQSILEEGPEGTTERPHTPS